MEITPFDEGGNVIKEAMSSKSSSVSEFEKDIGNKHIMQKSSSVEQEDSCKMVSESIAKVQLNEEIVEKETQLQKEESHEEDDNRVSLPRMKTIMMDRQTSTTSLEEHEKESKAEALLSMLSRGDVGSRPHSMPANLAHLWQSLKISSELNRSFDRRGSLDETDDPEASGHRVNVNDGLPNRPIDLEKLFTPASDSGEITPSRSRKIFASSSFYGQNHPTMEEQVELARRISHSLSDISNRESKGQSMYVNRKKRSVKWVHEGEGQLQENIPENSSKKDNKPSLKLVMDPRGQVQDISTLRKQGLNIEPPMSPEVCFDLVRDLNAPRGKGAELFAKRRKKSENWIIDESNVKTVENYQSTTHNLNKLPPPSFLKDTTHRVENVQKMNQIQERFTLPRLKLIKSPWEAALEGSVESAFQEINAPRGIAMAPTPTTLRKLATPTSSPLPPSGPVKDELYKPKPPRAWNPQPTCKTFSSVKLDKIFAGSPKSPVSIAYHPDTNTISSEPVIVENVVPNIATQLASYEILDKSILHEPKIRRPDQFLDYSSVQAKEIKKVENVENMVQEVNSQMSEVSEQVQKMEEMYVQEQSETFESSISEKQDFSITKTETLVEKEVEDIEVEDLCEREFNELSLKYEKVDKPEIKKPAALVPGALPLFDPSCDFSSLKGVCSVKKQQIKEEIKEEVKEEREIIKSEERKSYKKPPSMVPGAKPLFGGAVDLHLNDNGCQDRPYEKIPVKSLINSFEQSTRPVLKYKQVNENVAISPNKHLNEKYQEKETILQSVQSTEIEAKGKEWSEEEIQKIEHHYQLEKQKREIYDQQIQKYKQEMKALRKSNGTFTPIQTTNSALQNNIQYQNETVKQVTDQNYPQQQHFGGMSLTQSRIDDVPVKQPVFDAQSPRSDFNKNNFNTAPRGWQSSMSYYRPVTFNATQAYTDF